MGGTKEVQSLKPKVQSPKQALTARKPAWTASTTILRILVPPWVGMALAALVSSLISMRGSYEPGASSFVCLWLLLGLATDIWFGASSRYKLLTEFRLAASHRYIPAPAPTPRGAPATECALMAG